MIVHWFAVKRSWCEQVDAESVSPLEAIAVGVVEYSDDFYFMLCYLVLS
jgi:hypothetical protein